MSDQQRQAASPPPPGTGFPGLDKAIRVGKELRAKRGYYYRKWREGMKRYLRRPRKRVMRSAG